MKYTHCRFFLMAVALTLALLIIPGCGGGGGGSASTSGKVSLKTSRLLPNGTPCGAMELTLQFPLGITVQTDGNGDPLPAAVKVTGASDPTKVYVVAKYTAATTAEAGSLKFQIYDLTGFTSGEYIDLELDVTPGFIPKRDGSDFSFTGFKVSDLNGAVSTPQLPSFTIEIL